MSKMASEAEAVISLPFESREEGEAKPAEWLEAEDVFGDGRLIKRVGSSVGYAEVEPSAVIFEYTGDFELVSEPIVFFSMSFYSKQ